MSIFRPSANVQGLLFSNKFQVVDEATVLIDHKYFNHPARRDYGKKVSSPRIIVREGEVGSIIQETSAEKTFIEVVAKEGEIQSHKGILMNFVVGYFDKDGKKIVAYRPQILTDENKNAQITLGEEGRKETISFSVVAQRKAL